MKRIQQYVVLCACGCSQPTLVAPKTEKRCGQVRNQPVKYIHNHHTRPDVPARDYLVSRLVTTDTGCMEWIGGLDTNGYGRFGRYGGVAQAYAHRVSYELHHGPIPEGLVVRHRCDNPPCCNPEHLELGTLADNNQDRLERGGYIDSGRRARETRLARERAA